MSKNFENLWAEGPDPLMDDGLLPAAQNQNFLIEDMSEISAGVDTTSLVWLRLLQLRRMRNKDPLGNEWLARYGVDRFAKARALKLLEKRGLIKVKRSSHRGPVVTIIPPAKRWRADSALHRADSALPPC
jgi:hypothetical protein